MTTDVEKQEGQKTVVSFAAGLLIGGLLVWAFSGSPETDNAHSTNTQNGDEAAETANTDTADDMDGDATDNTADNAENGADDMTDAAPTMEMGEGSVELGSTAAGSVLTLDGATFPTAEGWVGVRLYTNGEVGSILGVSRYSEEQGLIPTEVELLSPMVAGRDYAVVFFAEDGDRNFNPALDAQLDTEVTAFTAQ